jgi:uncharacterized protein YceK
MNKKLVLVGILLLVALMLSGCVTVGSYGYHGDYGYPHGYYYHDYGYHHRDWDHSHYGSGDGSRHW